MSISAVPLQSPTTPRGRPSSSPAISPTQSPHSTTRTVLSVQLFQDRHVYEFAHLHTHEDDDTRRLKLAMEKGRLEEERRIGREKRQSMMGGHSKTQSEVRSVRRPLSLRRRDHGESSHRRAQSYAVGRSTSQPSSSRTPSSSRPAMQPRSASDIPAYNTLDVVVEREPSLPPEETSFAKSTYSWATQFSGETVELRTAAHYIPSADGQEEEEVLDSAEKLDRRRKRIVAIAHTVRQLEGVGSREKEDPTFFDVIARAWYDRPENTRESGIGPPDLLPAPPPFLPDFANGSTLAHGHATLRGYPPVTASSMSSPLEVDLRTPLAPDPLLPGRDSASTRRSRSIRYSYASTLHDLALDGGLQQGAKLMSDKAWLRMSKSRTPWGGDFGTPPTHQPFTPPEPPPLESSIVLDTAPPQRTLRKYKTTIAGSRSPAALDNTPTAGPSRGWGLGFVGSWWDKTPSAALTTSTPDVEQGFRMGEDGTARESRRSVVDPETHGPHARDLVVLGTGSPRSNHCPRQSSIRSDTSSTIPRVLRGRVDSGDTSETYLSPSRTETITPVLPQSPKTLMIMTTPPQPTLRRNLHPDYDRSSSPVSLRGTLTPGELDPISKTQDPHTLGSTAKAEYTAEAETKLAQARRSNASITLFFLGFFLPILWFVGGWRSARSRPKLHLETGAVCSGSRWTRWADNPDPWVTRCRWAAAACLPVLLIACILAIIIDLILR